MNATPASALRRRFPGEPGRTPGLASAAWAGAGRWRAGALAALCLGLGGIGCAVLPGAVNDDTYAFLDWGRDLRHGFLPLLEHRTFQPLPVVAGAVLSLLGSAAPTATIVLSLAALVALALAAWRIVALLGFPQPGPALAALLVLACPLLPVLAVVAYNNLPFATLVLWGLVFELQRRPRGAWTMLIVAGLVRPEAWLFLVAYGVLTWWRERRPRPPRRWLPIAILALGPMLTWLGLEWALFGDPLYSLHSTAGAARVVANHSGSPGSLWNALVTSMTLPLIVAAGVGAVATATLALRRVGHTTLGATVAALLTIAVLAGTDFNVPSRHFSVFVALLCVLAAAGAVTPARLLADRSFSPRAVGVAAFAGAALLVGVAAPKATQLVHGELRSVKLSHATGASLSRNVDAARSLIDVHRAARHSVAMQGALATSALVWALGVPYDAVSTAVGPQTLLVVQPSARTWRQLVHEHLTGLSLWRPTAGWHEIYAGAWDVYARTARTPVALTGS